MSLLTVDDKTIEYIIQYKAIKHLYFRAVDGKIYVSASKRFKEDQILEVMKSKFPKIYQMTTKTKHQQTGKYSLWGKDLHEDSFYLLYGLPKTEKNYQLILKHEVNQKIKGFETQLKIDLAKVNLGLIETKVKPLKTKYGSCHYIKKLITINSFMARIPEIYLYYVLLHEYAHLIVPNHSKNFYQVLDQLMPNHKNIQKALRKHVISF